MAQEITLSLRAGENVTRVAERILSLDPGIVYLPRHITELREAAQLSFERRSENLLLREVDRWRTRVERLGQGATRRAGPHSLRSATQQFVRDSQRARPEQVGRVVDRWALERARYQARVIARTETMQAYRDSYEQATRSQPYVKGYRWELSAGHPRPDICDVYAYQDTDGLGPGGYAVDNVPDYAHPHDMCTTYAIVDEHHFRREIAAAQNRPEPPREWESDTRETAAEWIGRLPEERRLELLGPTRARVFEEDPSRVVGPRGEIYPVHQVLGQDPPRRSSGERVDATGVVREDRASFVRPFNSLR